MQDIPASLNSKSIVRNDLLCYKVAEFLFKLFETFLRPDRIIFVVTEIIAIRGSRDIRSENVRFGHNTITPIRVIGKKYIPAKKN